MTFSIAKESLIIGLLNTWGDAMKHSEVLQNFQYLPDEAGVAIPVWMIISGRSRASVYRDINSGKLKAFHIGKSCRLRVGSCRSVLRGEV